MIRAGAGLYYENMVWNNILFDRPAKLTQGLFWGSEQACGSGAYCGQAVGSVYQSIAAQEASYQLATKAAGPAANGEYLGSAMAVPSTEGLTLFAPNYKTPDSYQMNIGVQRQLRANMLLSVDYVRSVGLHFVVASDLNHVGDARYLNATNAQTAIQSTVAACNAVSVDAAIQACPGLHPASGSNPVGPATIADFSAYGLDSLNVVDAGFPGANSNGVLAAFQGANSNWGQVLTAFPAGRSVYNALDFELQGQIRHLVTGVNDLNTTASYAYSRYAATGTTELGDADFIGNAFDNNHPTAYYGPTSLDRHNQFSVGLSATTFEKIQFSTVAHLYSSMPSTMFLPENGSADIFTSDWTGSGAMGDEPSTQGALVPGTNMGAFGRKYNGKNINNLIKAYNTEYAGTLTPAGQALVTAGLLSTQQMTELGGVMESLAQAPSNQVSNDILRSWDFTLGRDFKVLNERFTITPTFRAFNVLNAVNYNNRTGGANAGSNMIGGQLSGAAGSPNGTAGHIDEAFDRDSTGSGVYALGSPRQLEYSLRIAF